jgi:hypothetical protein
MVFDQMGFEPIESQINEEVDARMPLNVLPFLEAVASCPGAKELDSRLQKLIHSLDR